MKEPAYEDIWAFGTDEDGYGIVQALHKPSGKNYQLTSKKVVEALIAQYGMSLVWGMCEEIAYLRN